MALLLSLEPLGHQLFIKLNLLGKSSTMSLSLSLMQMREPHLARGDAIIHRYRETKCKGEKWNANQE